MNCERIAANPGRPVTAPARLAGSLAVALAIGAGMAPAATAAEAPADFVRMLGAQAFAVLRSDAPIDRKAAYFHRILRRDFDLDGISRFVLGPYWHVANAVQRREFCRLLEDYIVRVDGAWLANYGGESFRVTGSRSDAAGVVVTSEVVRRQGPPIEIDWRLGASGGFYKVSDLAIAGVSMALARRTEFAALIARQGGELDGLLAALRWETGNPAFRAASDGGEEGAR